MPDRRCLVEVPNAPRHRAERAHADADYGEEPAFGNYFTPEAGHRVEVVAEGGLLVVVGVGVGALGAVAGRVRDLDKAPAVEHKARPPAVGDKPLRPADLAEEEGCFCALLFVRV